MKKIKDKKKRNYNETTVIIVILTCASFLISIIIDYALHNISDTAKDEMQVLIDNAEENRDILFMNTINGTMLYVPINQKEAIAEATGMNGSKSVYLFMQTGDTVTLTDDVLVTKQKNIYKMMYAFFDYGKVSYKDNKYICLVSGTDKVIELIKTGWSLTEGQTLGALNNFSATSTDNTKIELVITSSDKSDFEFAINLYVDKKAYSIYHGITINNTIEMSMPVELYDYNSYAGLKTSDEHLDKYLQTVLDFMYEVAGKLNLDKLESIN